MKPRHWFFLVGVLFYLVGISFVVAGARALRAAPSTRPPETEAAAVATVKQIMKGIVAPAANAVFNSVSTSVTIKGVEEKAPQTDEEWEAVGNSAAALIESGNLLLMGSRVVDRGDWTKIAHDLIDAGRVALTATEAKSAEQLLASGEAINTSCDNCHRKYQRGG
jgi:hypothetical protein